MNQGRFGGEHFSGGGNGGGDGFYYYSNSSYGGGDDGYYQQSQQYYQEDNSQYRHSQCYDAADVAAVYPSQYYEEDAAHHAHATSADVLDQQLQHANEYYYDANHPINENQHPTSSYFYPIRAPLVVHPNGMQDDYGNYDTRGDAISAIAVTTLDNDTSTTDENDDVSPSSCLMYVASHSTFQGGGGGERESRASRGGGGGGRNNTSSQTLHRGSRLTVLYDHQHNTDNINDNTQDHDVNQPVIYSSFVGHPEANSNVLNGLHSVLFGGGMDNVAPPSSAIAATTTASTIWSSTSMKARPSHAFGPPIGPSSYVHHVLNNSVRSGITTNKRPEETHTMGISSIFEISTPYLGSGGRICSISPYGVRVHTRGGMIMSDSKHGVLSGMTCGVLMERGAHHFAAVGGMSSYEDGGGGSGNRSSQHVHCVDLHRDLKIISSHTLTPSNSGDNRGQQKQRLCVSDMAYNVERNSIVVGCSDGTIRVLDGGRRNVEVAKAKAQMGGVAKVAVWENLICASGYSSAGVSSPSSPLPYPFPSPHVLIYDVRYLGRGGIPHMFSANRGGPRFVDFLPDGKLLVGSGQTFGSLEVITPFHDETTAGPSPSHYFQPDLNAGESMTTMNFDGGNGNLHIGTSFGRVLRYGMTQYRKTIHDKNRTPQSVLDVGSGGLVRGSGSSKGVIGGEGGLPQRWSESASSGVDKSDVRPAKEPLDMPSFAPSPPELSIDPKLLCSNAQPSADLHIQGWNVFDGYVMASNPKLSSDKTLLHPRYSRSSVTATALGPLSTNAMVAPSKRWLSKKLQMKLEESSADMVKVFPTSSLGINDPLTPTELIDEEISIGNRREKDDSKRKTKVFPNPNKMIYSNEPFAACYDATANSRKTVRENSQGRDLGEEDVIEGEEIGIPRRYRLMIRPPFYKVTNFDYTLYNDTGLWVGWDYAPSFANSFACSVLTLLYFIGEIRSTALQLQLCSNEMSIQVQKHARRETNVSVTAELGLLFHLIESLSANGMALPDTSSNRRKIGQVKAFVPSNFISAFTLLTEAKNLALVDGVAGAAETARRPEAFYRFIMQYIDRELGQLVTNTSTQYAHVSANQGHLIDRLQGIGFLSVIEFVSGKPKTSTSRALTVELAYDQKLISRKTNVRFGEILRYSLCKEAPLRAWCEETRSYEAVIQRKIATNLPSLLSLSCCCAGRKAGAVGLQVWQQEDSRNWLPEYIEVHIETDKSVTVKELALNKDGEEEWVTFEQRLPLPKSFFGEWEKELPQDLPITKSYRLEAVVSFVRTNSDLSDDAPQREGHHVVHVRVPADFECKALQKQLVQIEKTIDSLNKTDNNGPITLDSDIPLEERRQHLLEQLREVEARETHDQWVLINGFVVSKLDNADDVRSFNAKFKEPSVVIFRETTGPCKEANDMVIVEPSNELKLALRQDTLVNVRAMETKSISNSAGRKSTKSDFTKAENLPGNGDLVAIDAEFVCVQQEESLITSSGSKEITSEPRNALARLSIIHCQTNEVIIDDYVLPMEPVVDYLTRFSGIVQTDLDPNSSPHSLVTPQEAYLKVRLLMERGCIFVGHGLSQDFRIINICIPPNQIIDTAEIYHQFNQRYISLRYLTNFVLGRDMQQEVHDSVEDARAAYELYRKALSLKKEGKFDEYLMKLYAHGHSTQFKLGVAK